MLRKMGETKTACKQFVSSFVECTDLLRTVSASKHSVVTAFYILDIL